MADLPFVVAPKRETRIVSAVVNGEECSLEFPVFGCWLAAEDIAAREHEYQSATYAETSRLTDALIEAGADESDAQITAVRIVSTRLGVPVQLSATDQRAMIRHADLIAGIVNHLAEESKQWNLRVVAAAISSRLPGCDDWDEARAATLPGPIRDAIVGFMDQERYGAAAGQDPEEILAAMAETLGKLGPAADSSPPPSTGPSVSGDASDSGPGTPPSAASGSPGSRPRSSSRRSKKASAG